MGLLHELKQRVPCPELQFPHLYEGRTGLWPLQAPTIIKVLAERGLGTSDILRLGGGGDLVQWDVRAGILQPTFQ